VHPGHKLTGPKEEEEEEGYGLNGWFWEPYWLLFSGFLEQMVLVVG
jgi:hypothetical protein